MKINEKTCSIHGILPNSYFIDIDGEFYFNLSYNFRKILTVKSYSRNKPAIQKNISCRIFNGKKYYRLLDDMSLCMPIILDKTKIYRYFCPICKFHNSNDDSRYPIYYIIRKILTELNCAVGISGSTLIGMSATRDYDIVLYNIEDVKNAAIHINKIKNEHNLKELTSWRRFVYNESIICLYLKLRRPPIYLERLPWPLDKNSKSNLMKFKVTDDSTGFAFPAYYKCIALMDGLKIKKGEHVIFVSIRPGHSGLLKFGEEFTIQCYEFNINGRKVALADPCNSWAEIKNRNLNGFVNEVKQ